MDIQIGNHTIGENHPTYFIADISANHDGDLERAKLLIHLAKEAGADAAKFQNFRAPNIVSDYGFKSLGGQISHQSTWKQSVFDVYKGASIPFEWTPILKAECDRVGIDYFSSPYDFDAIDMLDAYVPAYKIGSGDITWPEALEHMARKGKPVILATGASTIGDVQRAVHTLQAINPQLVVMQCNTNYTASLENFDHIHLRVLTTYRLMFPDVILGLSDHTPHHATVLGAVTLGARVIEKHLTDDNHRVGPDHPFSMTPATWREMVDRTRELERALGSADKVVAANEQQTVIVQRRCLRAACDLKAGEALTRAQIDVLRPATPGAILPYELDDVIGRHARTDIPAGKELRWTDLYEIGRVLYFTRDYTTHDRRFLAALAHTEHQVYFLRLEKRGHTLEDQPLPPQIEQIQWAGGQRPVDTPLDTLRLLLPLRQVITKIKPDLVHAGPLQTSALLSTLAGFRPLVSMSWGSDLLIEAGRSAWNRWATRYALAHSAVLVGDCAPVRQKAIAFGMADERIVTFPWGIDLRHFTPRHRENPGDEAPFTLISTRSWEPLLGVDLIARAFVSAARQCPQLRLVMLGNGSQAGLLHRIFMDGGVQNQVHFPGQIGLADLPRYYHNADLYIAATHSDGTSISLLEAMACGRPVLVSDIPGNREWVTPEVGWQFPDGSVMALAQAILNAVEQRSRLPEMGRAARQLVEQRADWDKNFPQLLHAYEMALASQTGD